jgi:hypothetical protein
MYLAALGGEAVTPPEPITRMDMYLAYLNGMTDTYPEPITRTEQYLYKLCQNGMGGGGGVTIRNQNKTITENGSYKADSGYTGLGTVTVNVPQQEPVVQALDVTENGVYNPPSGVDGFAPVTVNVEASGGGMPYDMGEFVLDEDTSGGTVVPHNLATVPDFVMVWTDDIAGTPAATDYPDTMGFIYARNWMGITRQYSSTMFGTPERDQTISFTRPKNFTTEGIQVGPTSNSYAAQAHLYTDKTFVTHNVTAANGSRWRAGVTYKYFVASAWWNIKEVNV